MKNKLTIEDLDILNEFIEMRYNIRYGNIIRTGGSWKTGWIFARSCPTGDYYGEGETVKEAYENMQSKNSRFGTD